MAKRPPEKYAPGELDRVRNNLGKISPEEAKRIAALLGGEVGVEKSDEALKKRYQSLKASRMNRTTPGESTAEKRARAKPHTPPPAKTDRRPHARTTADHTADFERTSFADRIKKDFFAARKEYRVKTFQGSLLSLLSFLLPIPDYVNEEFLYESSEIFINPLNEFVSLLRKLVPPGNTEIRKNICRHPYYERIINTLLSWDIDGLHKEVTKLQNFQRDVTFQDCRGLTTRLFRPYLVLAKLAPETQILKSVEFALASALRTQPAETQPGLKKTFEHLKKSISLVFIRVRRKCYPLLLKSVPVPYQEYDSFFSSFSPEVLALFNLTENDLIPATDPAPPQTAETAGREAIEEDAAADEKSGGSSGNESQTQDEPDFPAEEPPDSPPENAYTPIEPSVPAQKPLLTSVPQNLRKGMDYLARIYPGEQLDHLEKMPDLFPLLQRELRAPLGAEYVPPQDPLLQIVFLHSVLNELFYGFRSIELGVLSGQTGISGAFTDVLESVLDSWPYFSAELLEKQYFPRLIELQRQTERSREFLKSEYGLKLEADLRWIRRLYFLPYQEIDRASRVRRAPRIQDAPVLSESLSILKAILSEMTEDIDDAMKRFKEGNEKNLSRITCRTVENPWEHFNFEIENPVSRKLSALLYQRQKTPSGTVKVRDRRNNAHLIYLSAAIVELFEYLVNNQSSYFYRGESCGFLRTNAVSDQEGAPHTEPS